MDAPPADEPARQASEPDTSTAVTPASREPTADTTVSQPNPPPWLQRRADSSSWRQVEELLAQELTDTLPGGLKARNISHIAAFQDWMLAAIRFDSREAVYEPVYRLYSLSLTSGERVLLKRTTPGGRELTLWVEWKPVDRVLPVQADSIFAVFATHQNCQDCEATYLVSALYANPDSGWRPMLADSAGTDFMIGSDIQTGDYIWDFTCAYRVSEWNSTPGFELGTYCRQSGRDWSTDEIKEIRHRATIYSADGDLGLLASDMSFDEAERDRLINWICADPWHDTGVCERRD